MKYQLLNDDQRRALFLELHQSIEVAATEGAAELTTGMPPNLHYPPNSGFTAAEAAALAALPHNPDLTSALRKVLASAASDPVFHLLTFLDGVGETAFLDTRWFGAWIVPVPDEDEVEEETLGEPPFFHDDFFETYWMWREVRDDPGWRQDTYEGWPE